MHPSHIIDTHAHLCSPDFDQDRNDVISRAASVGLTKIVAVGETLADAKTNLKLAERFPMIAPAAGLYPDHLALEEAHDLAAFIRINRDRFFAIGEVGLDYWLAREEEERALQRTIFSFFIALANELELPLNVHSRSAGRHAVDLLIENKAQRVQLHAFDGKISAARPGVDAGYFFSIPPSIIRSPQKQKLTKHLPLESLLLESDSPVLGPEGDKRNEPANIVFAAEAVANLKNIGLETVYAQTLHNTCMLYHRIGC